MRTFLRFLVGISITLGIGVGLARLTAVRWWRVPDDDPYLEASIAPTLRGGDWILLWRLTPPHRGALVLCPEPKTNPARPVIGRIAALGGDRLEIKGSAPRINRWLAGTEGSCPIDKFETQDPRTGAPITQACSMEKLGGRVHPRGNVPSTVVTQPVQVTLNPGQLFLLSDNRLFPYDSREFGPVPQETCEETVVFRFVGKAGFKDVASRLTLIR